MNKNTNFILVVGNIDKNHIAAQKIYKIKFLDYQISSILNTYNRSKVFVVGSWSEDFKMQKIPRVKYIKYDTNDLNNIGLAIHESIKHISNSSLAIMNIEMFFDNKIISKLIMKNNSIIVNKNNKFCSKIGCTIENNKVSFIFYDLKDKVCEFVYIHKNSLNSFKQIIEEKVYGNMYLFEILNILIENNIHFDPCITNENIIHLYDNKDINKIRKTLKRIKNVSIQK